MQMVRISTGREAAVTEVVCTKPETAPTAPSLRPGETFANLRCARTGRLTFRLGAESQRRRQDSQERIIAGRDHRAGLQRHVPEEQPKVEQREVRSCMHVHATQRRGCSAVQRRWGLDLTRLE